jgi:hypothetical protein
MNRWGCSHLRLSNRKEPELADSSVSGDDLVPGKGEGPAGGEGHGPQLNLRDEAREAWEKDFLDHYRKDWEEMHPGVPPPPRDVSKMLPPALKPPKAPPIKKFSAHDLAGCLDPDNCSGPYVW